MNSTVSIICALYNYRQYVADFVHSVLRQTYTNWELIIIDDASTDNPEEILHQFSNESRICYTKLKENHGYSFARNIGILQSVGDFIVIADADDILTDDSIEVRLKVLLAHPEKLWCHADGKKIKADGQEFCKLKERGTRRERYGDIEGSHRQVHGGSMMMRKEFHEKLGLYDDKLKFSSDNEMVKRAFRFGIIPLYVPKVVTYYRQHPNQMHRSPEKKKVIDSRLNVDVIKEQIDNSVERRFQEGININNTKLLKKDRMKVFLPISPDPKSGKSFFFRRLLEEWKKDMPFDITTNPDNFVDVSIESARIKHKNSRLKVIRFDGVYHNTGQNFRQKNSSMVTSLGIADGAIYQSNFAKSMCREYLGKFNGFESVIYNGADPEFYAKAIPIRMNYEKIFISFSKWRPHKRLRDIIESFLLADIENSVLLIAGDLSRSGLTQSDINRYFSISNVRYIGILNQNQMAGYLKIATAAIHLCWIDACPNSVVEAIVAGVPVICNNNGGTAELVAKANGYVCITEKSYDRKPIDLYHPPRFSYRIVAEAMIQAANEKRKIVNDHVLISNSAEQYKNYILQIGGS